VLLKVRLEEMKDRFPDSKTFVEFLNRQIQELHKNDLANMSLMYGILDRSSLSFQYTTAGPWKPILWRKGAPCAVDIASNPPLGGMDHYVFRESAVQLMPGDLLILHTDGLDAAVSSDHGSAFDKIVRILEKEQAPTPLDVQNELMGLVYRYLDRQPLEDDLTLIHFAVDERALYVAGSQSK
jgi:serine phosphatase RsbU (regulator of sigma subunit)